MQDSVLRIILSTNKINLPLVKNNALKRKSEEPVYQETVLAEINH